MTSPRSRVELAGDMLPYSLDRNKQPGEYTLTEMERFLIPNEFYEDGSPIEEACVGISSGVTLRLLPKRKEGLINKMQICRIPESLMEKIGKVGIILSIKQGLVYKYHTRCVKYPEYTLQLFRVDP